MVNSRTSKWFLVAILLLGLADYGYSMARQPQDEGVVMKRWAGDTSGLYQFKHNSVYGQPPSGFYGESDFFEIKPGQEIIDVQIPLYPAI